MIDRDVVVDEKYKYSLIMTNIWIVVFDLRMICSVEIKQGLKLKIT